MSCNNEHYEFVKHIYAGTVQYRNAHTPVFVYYALG